MGPYQRTPKEVARASRFSGLGVRSVGPFGDFLGFPEGIYRIGANHPGTLVKRDPLLGKMVFHSADHLFAQPRYELTD